MYESLNNDELICETKRAVNKEHTSTLQVLDYLCEVESRRLFSLRGFSSLFDFCCTELGYSSDAAYRRISAMRTIRKTPAARAKLEEGSVSLGSLSLLHGFTRQEEKRTGAPLTTTVREELLGQIENKSRKECERVLAERFPEATAKKESTRAVSGELTSIRFFASRELMDDLKELRDLLGNRALSGHAELIGEIARIALEVLKKKRGLGKIVEQTLTTPAAPATGEAKTTLAAKVKSSSRSRSISAAVRRQVWRRDQGCCQYMDPKTRRKCGSRYAIQVDHILPFARGGESTLENLQLLCAAHNQLRAIDEFGADYMLQFIPNLKHKFHGRRRN